MRVQSFLGYLTALVAFLQLTAAAPLEDSTEPEILATASFPETNAFGHVVNGEANRVWVSIENKSNRNVTLQAIAGSFHDTESNKVVKNTTALSYSLPLLEGAKLKLPYQFYSEFKPGDIRLNLWVEHTVDDQKYRVPAYDSIVTIVEPEASWFDPKLWITYLIVLGFFGGIGYYAYLTFVPQPKKRKTVAPVSAPVGTVTATGAGGYQEEWIPEHHLKKPKQRKSTKGVATSGDETSGTELSGTEGRKRKGKK
ncbi:hypothetical protein QCA50_005718 [Cerrena zonata]|uniref:Translocon-associated protein subunit alpha n=1 Tax=Cerrena zonata TaxID=2478898 RepID=A0AAW0GHC4_9APHY